MVPAVRAGVRGKNKACFLAKPGDVNRQDGPQGTRLAFNYAAKSTSIFGTGDGAMFNELKLISWYYALTS
jgi:hypothetical protein